MDNFIGHREVISRTMNDEYGDGSDHKVCLRCGMCRDCGDCKCSTSKSLFILNGFPRSGKDEFANLLIKHLDKFGICGAMVSSVEVIKEVALLLGWNGEKDQASRNALSELKDLATKHWDHPFKMMCENADSISSEEAIIYMIREPEEIIRFKERYPETITIFIERGQHETANNHADQNVNDFNYDLRIENNGTLEQLEESAKQLVHNLFSKGALK